MRKRRENWPSLLAAAIDAARSRPFQWGEHDCALFAANVVRELTGEDLAASFRGRYGSHAEAVALLGARGGLEAVVTATLGAPLSTPKLAQRGDVVMVATEEGPALGVCMGAHAACAAPGGVSFKLMDDWQRAWKVGRQ